MAVAAARELRSGGAAVRVAPVLRQRRAVADQAGLDARRRQANMAGALEVLPGGARLLEGARVVLVDDLMTTGASLAEAARALDEARVVRVSGEAGAAGVVRVSGGTDAGNGGDSHGVPETFSGPGVTSGPGRGELPRGDHGSVLIGAAVVAASPKAFGINRN
nr:phosphoribosyltransferase family protein [Streptomyces thermolilacinus]